MPDSLELALRPPLAEIRLREQIPAAEAARAQLVDDIDRAAETVAGAEGVRVVLLVLAGASSPVDAGAARTAAFRSLELLPQPVIAAIEGDASGALLELALACDIRVASETASFCIDAAAGGGEAIKFGGTQRLPRLIGRTRASQMILLGDRIDAATALDWGLVNAVTPPGAALKRAEEIAASIVSRGPLAVRYAKEAVARGLDMSLEQALRYETDLTVILQTTADRAEGIRAFLEKRQPQFRGD